MNGLSKQYLSASTWLITEWYSVPGAFECWNHQVKVSLSCYSGAEFTDQPTGQSLFPFFFFHPTVFRWFLLSFVSPFLYLLIDFCTLKMTTTCRSYVSLSHFSFLSFFLILCMGLGKRGVFCFTSVRCFLLLIQLSVKGDNAELEPIDSWLITQGMVRTSPVALSPPQCPPVSIHHVIPTPSPPLNKPIPYSKRESPLKYLN